MKITHLFHFAIWYLALVCTPCVYGGPVVCTPCVYGGPVINVVPLSHDFGQVEVGSAETVVITIHNEGDDHITIYDANFPADSSGDYGIISLFWPPVFFTAGGQFDLTIEFAPSVNGPSEDILRIFSNDPDQPLVEVVLTGEGTGGETTPPEQIAEINEFVKTAVDDRTLVGTGGGSSARNRLRTFAKKLQIVESLIEDEFFSEAETGIGS
jgi:hypothetical protein